MEVKQGAKHVVERGAKEEVKKEVKEGAKQEVKLEFLFGAKQKELNRKLNQKFIGR